MASRDTSEWCNQSTSGISVKKKNENSEDEMSSASKTASSNNKVSAHSQWPFSAPPLMSPRAKTSLPKLQMERLIGVRFFLLLQTISFITTFY